MDHAAAHLPCLVSCLALPITCVRRARPALCPVWARATSMHVRACGQDGRGAREWRWMHDLLMQHV